MSTSRILSKVPSDLANNIGKVLTVGEDNSLLWSIANSEPAFSRANLAFDKASSAGSNTVYLQGALDQTNTNISSANTQLKSYTDGQITDVNSYIQSVYDSSNTKFSSSGGVISGSVEISSSLLITGNLTVTGNVTSVSANNLSIQDNMIYLNANNYVSNPDLGFAGNYFDGTYRHAGFFRDATDGVWKVFDSYLPEPDASPYIDTSNSSFRIASFQANNITANVFIGSGASLTSINNTSLVNSAITINGTSVSLGQSITVPAGLTLQTVKTSNFTAFSGNSYPVNTTSGAITVTLPASPAAGDQINIIDYAGTASTNAITLYPNGKNINATSLNSIMNISRSSVTLIYVDSTQGWVDLSIGNSSYIPKQYAIDFLVVAGGAGGGGSGVNGGGGGGAGGYISQSNYNLLSGTSLPVIVGGGGSNGASGSAGGNSSFSGYTSIGGGGGGSFTGNGGSGGSGGGSGRDGGSGGSGTSGQGNSGGSASRTSCGSAGGGGGASQSGYGGGADCWTRTGTGSQGGAGSQWLNGSYYAGGGGGAWESGGSGAPGGIGGGGVGGGNGTGTPGSGTSNTGGGGGGGQASNTAGNGGSGIVIIRYLGVQKGTGGSITSSGGYTYHTFTSSGTFIA